MTTAEEFREYSRLFRLAFPERVRETHRRAKLRWEERHPGRQHELHKIWRDKNREWLREAGRIANAKSLLKPENYSRKLEDNRRRALKKREVEIEDCSKKIKILSTERFCHWCCRPIYNGGKRLRTIDHVTPIARGGKHCPDNLVAACCSCNSSKNDSLVSEWSWKMYDEDGE